MIPNFNEEGNLPPGIHTAEWFEIVERFGSSPYRRELLRGLMSAAVALKFAGCKGLFIDGSFSTEKRIPKDYDVCWDISGVNLALLDPTLLNFTNNRAAQRAKYLGEFFPTGFRADHNGRTFLQFFQIDKNTGKPKGIIRLDLRSLK